MRVFCNVITSMGRRRPQHDWHLSSMRAGQNTMWEDRTLRVININEAIVLGLGINSPSSFACAKGYLPATTLIAIVMAGEDRGSGTRLFNSFSFSNMLLCFILLGTIQGSDTAGVLGGSCSGCHLWNVPEERDAGLTVRNLPSA